MPDHSSSPRFSGNKEDNESSLSERPSRDDNYQWYRGQVKKTLLIVALMTKKWGLLLFKLQ